MILVTAATGQVGRAAVRELVLRGERVRAMARAPTDAAGLEGAEIVRGSYDDVSSLARALEGVSSVFLSGRDSPGYVSQLERAIRAAERAGVGRIVLLSAIGASVGSPVALMRDHHEVEQRLLAGRTSWTILRPHLYMQNFLRAADAIRTTGRLTAPMGDLEIPFVDTDDVGAAAAAVLAEPAAHAGTTYLLTGPEALDHDEVAAALARLVGHPVAYENVSPDDYEAALLNAGVPEWRAADLACIWAAYAARDCTVSPDLPVLLGREARSLDVFLEAHRGAFAGRSG